MRSPPPRPHLWPDAAFEPSRSAAATRAAASWRVVLFAYGIAALLGLALDAWTYPLGRLFPSGRLTGPLPGDWAQHAIGQLYFVADKWRWPLLRTKLLDWPQGASIVLTDSIPLAALATKLLRAVLPHGFYSLFLWMALCRVLQPVAAVFALRCFGERRLMPSLAVAALASAMPILLARYPHPALSAQFLVLLALGLYARIVGRHRDLVAQAVLLAASLLVHPYLLVMVVAALAAAPLTLLLRRERLWRRAALVLALDCLVVAGLARLLGYGGRPPRGDYGHYALNLLSPVWPHWSSLMPWFGGATTADVWDFEGYNWLGAGMLLLVATTVWLLVARRGPAWPGRDLARHPGLLLAALGLVALAVSSRVYLGPWLVLDLGPVPGLLDQARASGRFFWPVADMVMLAALLLTWRRLRPGTACLLSALAVLLQLADTSGLMLKVRENSREAPPWSVDAQTLRPLLAAHRELVMWPTAWCGGDFNLRSDYLQVLELAADTAIPTSTMKLARADTDISCDYAAQAETPLRAGELRVFLPTIPKDIPPAVAQAKALCRPLGALVVCTRQVGLLRGLPEPLPVSDNVQLASAQGQGMLLDGWAPVGGDPGGARSTGSAALLRFDPAPAPRWAARLTLWGHAVGSREALPVSVSVNGTEVARWAVAPGGDSALQAVLAAPVEDVSRMLVRLEIGDGTPGSPGDAPPDGPAPALQLTAVRLDPWVMP